MAYGDGAVYAEGAALYVPGGKEYRGRVYERVFAVLSVYSAVSNATNKASLFTLESSEETITYYSSLLNIAR